MGKGDLLLVDGSLHSLEQGVTLLGVKLKVPFTGVTPATRLKGKCALKTRNSQEKRVSDQTDNMCLFQLQFQKVHSDLGHFQETGFHSMHSFLIIHTLKAIIPYVICNFIFGLSILHSFSVFYFLYLLFVTFSFVYISVSAVFIPSFIK